MLALPIIVGYRRAAAKFCFFSGAVSEAQGRAESLKRLLTRRFGPLPDSVVQWVNGASIDLPRVPSRNRGNRYFT